MYIEPSYAYATVSMLELWRGKGGIFYTRLIVDPGIWIEFCSFDAVIFGLSAPVLVLVRDEKKKTFQAARTLNS